MPDSIMRRWLKSTRAPSGVRREIAALQQAALRGTATEVDECHNCGQAHFYATMVDLSTQERQLVLCQRCADARSELLAMEARHAPTRPHGCLCEQPLESPIHFSTQEATP